MTAKGTKEDTKIYRVGVENFNHERTRKRRKPSGAKKVRLKTRAERVGEVESRGIQRFSVEDRFCSFRIFLGQFVALP